MNLDFSADDMSYHMSIEDESQINSVHERNKIARTIDNSSSINSLNNKRSFDPSFNSIIQERANHHYDRQSKQGGSQSPQRVNDLKEPSIASPVGDAEFSHFKASKASFKKHANRVGL